MANRAFALFFMGLVLAIGNGVLRELQLCWHDLVALPSAPEFSCGVQLSYNSSLGSLCVPRADLATYGSKNPFGVCPFRNGSMNP
jgi:hypothetical protein